MKPLVTRNDLSSDLESVETLLDTIAGLRDSNNNLRIERDHLKADNVNLQTRLAEYEAKEQVKLALGSQGFTS